jgi:broad specificity phosphatase PhoE
VPAAGPRVVFLVRHAEKGQGQDPSLTDAGRERAKALARVLGDAHIDAIYTSEAIRTVQTAEPLASKLGLMINKDPMGDISALIGHIREEQAGQHVLIVGHSNTVPEAIASLGVPDPVTIGEADFDNLFVVTPNEDGSASLIRLRYGPAPN